MYFDTLPAHFPLQQSHTVIKPNEGLRSNLPLKIDLIILEILVFVYCICICNVQDRDEVSLICMHIAKWGQQTSWLCRIERRRKNNFKKEQKLALAVVVTHFGLLVQMQSICQTKKKSLLVVAMPMTLFLRVMCHLWILYYWFWSWSRCSSFSLGMKGNVISFHTATL